MESNLNSIARTPKEHRVELLERVHKPELIRVVFEPSVPDATKSCSLAKVSDLCQFYDLDQDPYVLKLREDPSSMDSDQYQRTLLGQRTYCLDQLKRLLTKGKAIQSELGTWATEHYIRAVVEKFSQASAFTQIAGFESMEESEKTHLAKLLTSIEPNPPDPALLENVKQVTPKVQCLVDYLKSVQTHKITCLIFVQTRAACAVLAQMLSEHPILSDWVKIGTFVGASSPTSRKSNIGELIDLKSQEKTLDHFRSGQKNIVVTTSALEEGIDVSACNLVICFEKPPLLKSFIQRRGRARKKRSWYVLFFQSDDEASRLPQWQQYEEIMRRQYEDEMRQREEIRRMEDEISGERSFEVETTGAKMSLEDSVQHLYHFCDTLPRYAHTDNRPLFQIRQSGETFSARVVLPNSVDESVRTAQSSRWWPTEKLAKRDAALEAYIALYKAELLSDHLLPLHEQDAVEAQAYEKVQKIASLVEVKAQVSMWPRIARAWQHPEESCSTMRLWYGNEIIGDLSLLLPLQLPIIPPITIFWDRGTTYSVILAPASRTDTSRYPCKQDTDVLLRPVFGSRMDIDKLDFTVFFGIPSEHQNVTKSYAGTQTIPEFWSSATETSDVGLIRDLANNRRPFIFYGLTRRSLQSLQKAAGSSSIDGEVQAREVACLQVKRFPKRTDFLHGFKDVEEAKATKGQGFQYLLPSECTVDKIPFKYARFALFIPSVLHVIENNLVAESLATHLLRPVDFKNLQLVLEAITATAARESRNYQRLEFLGDSHLKYLTSLTLVSQNPRYHEGILSHQKDHIVSNSRLARASLAADLDKYIRTVPFTGKKWRPMYNSDFLDEYGKFREIHVATRQMSTKTLADVIEALIGAAYLDGGTPKAVECLKVLLPGVSWVPVPELVAQLHDIYSDSSHPYPVHFSELEKLLDYSFRTPNLLTEALTHPAHHADSSASYQRLEFLGDSILDVMISTKAFQHNPPPSVHRLHLIRTALVNADFLAFLCLHHSIMVPSPKKIVVANDNQNRIGSTSQYPRFEAKEEFTERHVWHFLRHTSPAVRSAQVACSKRFATLRQPIIDALEHSNKRPWALLAALDAPKFFSDVVESIIGAIYVDSKGDLGMCEAFLKRLGILKQLERALSGDASLMHPKEELGIVADQEAVKYVVETVGREGKEAECAGAKSEQMGGRLVCTVLIGEEAIVKVVGGVSRLEIETRAAEKAVRVLKENGKGDGRTQHEDHEVMEDIATVVRAHESQPEEEGMGKRKREESGSGNEGDDYDVERDEDNYDEDNEDNDDLKDLDHGTEIFYDASEDIETSQ